MIAVWYHCKISGKGIPDAQASRSIVEEQMRALRDYGLEYAATEIHFGINGNQMDVFSVERFIPDKAQVYIHGQTASTELPTLKLLQKWIPLHSNWLVFYHHSKAVTQPKDEFHHHHRRVMQLALVERWKRCVDDLRRGYDAVGINLVHPVKRKIMPGAFFAGNFWWARSNYLSRLPRLPNNLTWENRCLCEGWVCKGYRTANLMDYERPELYPLAA